MTLNDTLFAIMASMVATLLLFPYLAQTSLNRIGATERFSFPMRKMILVCGLGALLPAVTLQISKGNYQTAEIMMLIMLGGILGLGAWIDRQSAYAPDGIMLPFCLIIAFIAPLQFSGSEPIVELSLRALIAFGLYIFGIVSWFPQEMSGVRIIPPADVMALAAPLLVFGISATLAMIYLVTSILLLLALKSEKVARIFSSKEAVDDGSSDVELKKGNAVTFLSVIFPVFLLAICLQIPSWGHTTGM